MNERFVKVFLKEVQSGLLPDPRLLCERLKILELVEIEDVVMCTNKNGDTPLLTAARSGQLQILEKLHAEHGVSLEHTNADGKTALHEAAQAGHADCVRFLLRAGARVDCLKKADWYIYI